MHRLVKGRKLYLAGLLVPHRKGLLGHSDGDVVLHAVADAILGALAKPDIGCYFPDTDPKFKGVAGREVIRKVAAVMKKEKFAVGNLDIVILCEEPKLAPLYEAMRKSVAALLAISPKNVGIKAKTMERLGDIGKGKAIACFANVSLDRRNGMV